MVVFLFFQACVAACVLLGFSGNDAINVDVV
jgi:hypothetical protein